VINRGNGRATIFHKAQDYFGLRLFQTFQTPALSSIEGFNRCAPFKTFQINDRSGQNKGDRLLFPVAITGGAVIDPCHAKNPARAAGWICLPRVKSWRGQALDLVFLNSS
jgi:hypothetical protein